jgi:hemoglobin-like flavoprotein
MAFNIELLEQSFEQIKPRATEFVASFYENLFTDYPQTQALFAKTNMAKQQDHLLSALILVIENLHNPEGLRETLKALGLRHVGYETLPEYYPLVGAELLKTFELYLGDAWTPEVKQAWIDAYDAIAQEMLAGAAEAD